jgi:hypothetical protein
MKVAKLMKFEHDEDEEGWCSFCDGPAPRGVLVKTAAATGGSPQLEAKFDPNGDGKQRDGKPFFFYRVGTCCIAGIVQALEKRE